MSVGVYEKKKYLEMVNRGEIFSAVFNGYEEKKKLLFGG
jgi:hypothetical protein